MKERAVLPKRSSSRLASWDYASPAWYFVIICTKNSSPILGEILDGEILLSIFGRIAHQEWMRSAQVRSELTLDAFVLMPNQLHGIVCLEIPVGSLSSAERTKNSRARAIGRSPLRKPGPPPRSLGSFVAGLKWL